MVPEHIAFIMDGNGRWATKVHKPRKYGHKMGTEALKRTVENCAELGVKYVTFYAFSTENWARPKDEVDYLFDIIRKFFAEIENYAKRDFRIIFIGNISALPEDIYTQCKKVMQQTEGNNGTVVSIALNYGSWEEVVSAANKLAKSGKEITKDTLTAALYTADVPFPDMVVRTGGEIRLSNFLLLQSAYAELFFTATLWPDFDKNALLTLIDEFKKRNRRFGSLDK